MRQSTTPLDVAMIVRQGFDTDPRAASFTPEQREIAEATMVGVCEGMIEAVTPLVAELDHLRDALNGALVALNRWHDGDDHDEQFVMDARALLAEAAS